MKHIQIHIRPPKIHWRLYLTRKVITLGVIAVILYMLDFALHVRYVGRGGEFALGTLLEHCLFGIPFEEG